MDIDPETGKDPAVERVKSSVEALSEAVLKLTVLLLPSTAIGSARLLGVVFREGMCVVAPSVSRRWYPIRNETAVQRAGSPAGFRRERRPCRGLEAICQGGPDGDALYNINPTLDVTDAGNFLRFGGQYRSIRIGNLV